MADQNTAELINELFEECPKLVQLLEPKLNLTVHSTTEEIIEQSRSILLDLINRYSHRNEIDPQTLDTICSIVAAHPRLGVPNANISGHSSEEQKSLAAGAAGDTRELAQQLIEINSQYETQFPGLRFVVWVNGRSRVEIIAVMGQRMARNDWIQEVKDSFNAMADIALDRHSKKAKAKANKNKL